MIGIPEMVYVGNHGLERLGREGYEVSPEVKEAARVIKSALTQLSTHLKGEGIIVENKGLTASIHYRLSPRPEQARTEILRLINELPQSNSLQVVEGKMVVNLLPGAKSNKGTATLKLIGDYGLQGAIYLGDDLTDLDAFRAIRQARTGSDFQGLVIGVLSQETPPELALNADLALNGVDEVERLLGWMVRSL